MSFSFSSIPLFSTLSTANIKILLFSGLLMYLIKISNPYKIPKASPLTIQNYSQITENLHTDDLINRLDPYFQQNPSLNALRNINSKDEKLDSNMKIIEDESVKEKDSEHINSLVKRSIEDGNPTQAELKDAILARKDIIFESNRINDLFDLLNESDDKYKEEFFWKGQLYQLIYNNDIFQKLYTAYIKNMVKDAQADNVFDFVFKNNFFCKIQNNDFFVAGNMNNQDTYEKDEDVLKLKRIISPDRNFLEENKIFLMKFNKSFKLYWEHNFAMFSYLEVFSDYQEDAEGIYKLNKINLDEYEHDFRDMRSDLISNEKIIIDDGFIQNNVVLTIVGSSGRNRDFFLKATKNLANSLNDLLRDCKNKIDFQKMSEIVMNERVLTKYGMEILQKFSIIIREKIYRNIGGNLDDSHNECNGELVIDENLDDSVILSNEGQIFTENSISILVQDWSSQSKCDEKEYSQDCLPNINVFVGFTVNLNQEPKVL
ncbi:hypothetical protein EDEG_03750 [Edhazardia aedis USNM 41457]|uniref:Uncharacterized protein n=1 Tax=Edhazardia aedis (strain USNM 41457) TaxID=1003232 RepID=J9DGJ8_EDHAE|nr:hypothetical protein EDEG_03750 [Edhazardia aedis USNM 41457]|eukprot:EJW01725.1 hypothetical protein EDEG_03750 [Edhazardia aedis USNM 41457]